MNNTKLAFMYLAERNVIGIPQLNYFNMLYDFMIYQGDEALQALAGFHVWVVENIEDEDKQERMLKETFFHDLTGAKDVTMLPRSSDYHKFWVNRNF